MRVLPFPNEYYEGCYINYPDADMLAYAVLAAALLRHRGFVSISATSEAAL